MMELDKIYRDANSHEEGLKAVYRAGFDSAMNRLPDIPSTNEDIKRAANQAVLLGRKSNYTLQITDIPGYDKWKSS